MYDAGDYNISKIVQYLSQGKDSAKQNYYSNIHLFPQRNPLHTQKRNLHTFCIKQTSKSQQEEEFF